MKIAISGKGGVGKTTLSACLARYFAKKGNKVIAVDADPDANLGTALGLDYMQAAEIVPLTDMKELVEERTGQKREAMAVISNLIRKYQIFLQR